MTKQLGSQVPIVGESFEARREAFLKDVDELGSKHKIALKPELKYTTDGIIATFKVFDATKKPDNGQSKDQKKKE